jgi:hypothetical protein
MHTLLLTKRRTLVVGIASALALSACAMGPRENLANLSEEDKMLSERFRGLRGGVLRVDAVGYPKQYVSITTETGARLDGSATLTTRNVMTSSFGGGPTIVPKSVRATWKKDGPPVSSNSSGNWNGGTIIGDYTVPVAQRIPQAILDDVRKNGGALRLKIRLHDEGIYIGWDVEYFLGSGIGYRMAGGDFREAGIINGKIVRHAWYIDKKGSKVFTDENPHAANFDPMRALKPVTDVKE